MPEKVLVIDDDIPSGKAMMWAMQAMGHDVQVVLDGKSALEAIEAFVPGVVLCDITMPGMQGYEVCERMRADPRMCHTLFIAQTGLNSASSKKLTHKAGFHYHMVKPIDINALFETVFIERNKMAQLETLY